MSEPLAGREVVVSVGEPWNFESSDDHNVLFGRVATASPPGTPVPDQRIELAVTPFASKEGPTVDTLVAQARYVDEVGIVERLSTGQDINVNLSYSDQVPEEKRLKDVSPFLIGSVEPRWSPGTPPKRPDRGAIRPGEPVTLTEDLPEHGLKAGRTGKVVHAYGGRVAYEVEFPSPEGGRKAPVLVGGSGVVPR